MRQPIYYKIWQDFITNVTVLLQNATAVTKCVIKVCYKMSRYTNALYYLIS